MDHPNTAMGIHAVWFAVHAAESQLRTLRDAGFEGGESRSVEVADLGKARRLAESGTGRKLETYKGFYGASFLLPREVAHGMWMEMYQPAGRSVQTVRSGQGPAR